MHRRSYIDGHEGHVHFLTDSQFKVLKMRFGKINLHQDMMAILKALSDPTKLNIYLLLHRVDEIPVTDIGYILNMNQSTVSHALADLKKLDLVDCSRCGQLMCYSLKKQTKKRLSFLKFFEKFFA